MRDEGWRGEGCPGFLPKHSSSAATWWWESVNLLGNSPKGGWTKIKSVLERSATSHGVRVVFLHKSVICVYRPIVFDKIWCPDPGMWTVFVLTAVLVFVNVVSVGTIGDSDLASVSEVRVCVPVVIMSESVRSRMAARG